MKNVNLFMLILLMEGFVQSVLSELKRELQLDQKKETKVAELEVPKIDQ